MGTALLARGLALGVSPERWLVERVEEVAGVHAMHAAAGAEVITTCSFNLASNRVDRHEVQDLAVRAVEVARRAAPGRIVAAGVGPSGLWSPASAPPDTATVAALYSRAFSALARAGADLVWAESLYSAAEARVALCCALEVGKPAVTTVVFTGAPGGRAALPDGAPADELLEELAATGAAAVGVNCVLPGTPGLSPLLTRLVKRVAVPVVAKPSAGLPGHVMTPEAFGAWCRALREAGASWIGGCCGASADHVAAAARAVHPR
jgi:5-methyltetrahydrofolate--homocysteine methyltransferase